MAWKGRKASSALGCAFNLDSLSLCLYKIKGIKQDNTEWSSVRTQN